MKANKTLRRLAKMEALLADIKGRYSAKASDLRQVLQEAGASIARAKEIVRSQAAAKVSREAKEAVRTRKKAAVKKAVSAKISKPEKKRAPRKQIVKEKAAAMTPSVSAPISPVVSGTNIGDVG